MSPSMIYGQLKVIFPDFIITKYGRVNENTIWIERKGVNGRELFTLDSKDSYILKKESR